ncbi:MAG TPA: alanine racemase [Acidimicrobiales bacterium]|jgi:alanine racemase|nr:alanine racemase [Acidimicrobiales bacterium]
MAEGTFKKLKAGMKGPVALKPTAAEKQERVALAQGRSRPTWAEVDLSAIAHNARVLANVAQPAQLCAVVKAHGYGHGAPSVARAAQAGGAAGLAVALVDEGVELRQNNVHGPVLLLSECGTDAVDDALAYRLTPTLYTLEGIAAFGKAALMLGQRTAVHVKVDTGMHRVGATPEELPTLLAAIAEDPLLVLEGLWTHFPVADGVSGEDRHYTLGQIELFDRVIKELERAGFRPDVLHAANTAGAIAYPAARYNMVRCGIGLYGHQPSDAVAAAFDAASPGVPLRPALSLKARVVAVRQLAAGERPSYGRLRPLPERSYVATIPIGYADGVPRNLFTAGYGVLIGGKRRPLAGMVTMDQIVVDCGDDASVQPGDEVVLLGRQGNEEITANEWATMLGTINYEILCGIGPRVPRVFTNGPAPKGSNLSPPMA